jgi:hypothetical protein
MPLNLRRKKSTLQYVLKLKSNPHNPTCGCMFKPTLKSTFCDKSSLIPPLTYRIRTQLDNTKINLNMIATFTIPDAPLWQMRTVDFLYVLTDIGQKSKTPPEVFQSTYNKPIGDHPKHVKIFIDSCKEEEKVADAALSDDRTSLCGLPDNTSIVMAELRAILLAIMHI